MTAYNSPEAHLRLGDFVDGSFTRDSTTGLLVIRGGNNGCTDTPTVPTPTPCNCQPRDVDLVYREVTGKLREGKLILVDTESDIQMWSAPALNAFSSRGEYLGTAIGYGLNNITPAEAATLPAQITINDLDGVTIRRRLDGKVEAVVPDVSEPEPVAQFYMDTATGQAKVAYSDGTVLRQWQCIKVRGIDNTTLGWAFPYTGTPEPTVQADIPLMDPQGALLGWACSTPIDTSWDVRVLDTEGTLLFWAASTSAVPHTVAVQDANGTVQYYVQPTQ